MRRYLPVVAILAALCLVGITFGITRALDNRPTVDQVQDRQDDALIAMCERANAITRKINVVTGLTRDYLATAAERSKVSPIPGGKKAADRYLLLRDQMVPLVIPDCRVVVLHPGR